MNILFFLTPKNEVAYVEENDSMRQVLEKMEHTGYTAIPCLTQDGKYIGTITEGDLLWEIKGKQMLSLKETEKIRITAVPRRRDNEAVNVLENLENLLAKVINQNFVPVVDDRDIFIGIITRRAILLYLTQQLQQQEIESKPLV